jgi:hypothetical protein
MRCFRTPGYEPGDGRGDRAAAVTSAIYLVAARSHVIIANAVAAAAILSNCRVNFATGVGWMREENDYTEQDVHTVASDWTR